MRLADVVWRAQTHDLQAQDRAYRIGQRRFTRVYRFVASGTIEELLYARQVFKQQFANIAQEVRTHRCGWLVGWLAPMALNHTNQASYERRYFNKDELFGLSNLLSDLSKESKTRLLINRTLHRER